MLIHPMPDPVLLALGPVKIHWYGVMYLLAFAQFIGLGLVRLRQPHIARAGWTRAHLEDMLFYGVLGVVIGGRLGEVLFYHPVYYFTHPLEIFAMLIWTRRNGRKLMDAMDFIAPMVPLGYAFGRIGNFINAELWGRVADPSLPWAMIWPNVDTLPRHPSPLYQALVDGLLMFILLWLFARKQRPRLAVSGMFSLLYGCARFFTEYFRVPDYEVTFAGWTISAGQMLSIPMIVLGLILLYVAYRRPEKSL
jgi:phosphatidylglycerol:prolipoprotein diacylglycerol transferase